MSTGSNAGADAGFQTNGTLRFVVVVVVVDRTKLLHQTHRLPRYRLIGAVETVRVRRVGRLTRQDKGMCRTIVQGKHVGPGFAARRGAIGRGATVRGLLLLLLFWRSVVIIITMTMMMTMMMVMMTSSSSRQSRRLRGKPKLDEVGAIFCFFMGMTTVLLCGWIATAAAHDVEKKAKGGKRDNRTRLLQTDLDVGWWYDMIIIWWYDGGTIP